MSACAQVNPSDLADEPRFDYHLLLGVGRNQVELVFDKQKQAFLLTVAQEDGRAARLVMTPRELERTTIELLLAARLRLGLGWPTVSRSS